MNLITILLHVLFCHLCSVVCTFNDVTHSVGLQNVKGLLAAFGDFNADKETDLFIITSSDKERCVEVLLWHKEDQKFERSMAKTCFKNSSNPLYKPYITNVVPGDFDGDGCLDIVIAVQDTIEKKQLPPTHVYVAWGLVDSFDEHRLEITDHFLDQPLVLDVNGDLLPDLFGTEFESKQRTYWINLGNKSFISEPQHKGASPSPLRVPHSNAFLDLTSDYTADLFITTEPQKGLWKFELWENENGALINSSLYYNFTISNIKYIGQSVFTDVDLDGVLDHVLPACFDNSCDVYVHSKGKWSILAATSAHNTLKFFNKKPNIAVPGVADITLRAGDFNLDGYPDFLAVVYTSSAEGNIVSKVLLLENSPCTAHREVSCNFARTLVYSSVSVPAIDKPVFATFVDLYENGVLDILVVSEPLHGQFKISALQNNLMTDSCFLKVLVLQGQCFDSCSGGHIPYGVNHAGPFITYTTTDSAGLPQKSAAAQLSQSAYFSLQMPYVVLGLGRAPNFVDRLSVGIPSEKNGPKRFHYWTSIIPNSQVIIIPYPPDTPSRWKSKLLVTPSKLVLMTAGAMLATCLFIGAVIGVLHWKEKRADQLEKRQDAHKFHFDAM